MGSQAFFSPLKIFVTFHGQFYMVLSWCLCVFVSDNHLNHSQSFEMEIFMPSVHRRRISGCFLVAVNSRYRPLLVSPTALAIVFIKGNDSIYRRQLVKLKPNSNYAILALMAVQASRCNMNMISFVHRQSFLNGSMLLRSLFFAPQSVFQMMRFQILHSSSSVVFCCIRLYSNSLSIYSAGTSAI